MANTVNLGLPLIAAAQAQKHVTHNEALRLIDTLAQLAVLTRTLNAPPGALTEGQRWIVKASPAPTGVWAGHGNQIAAWQDGAWQFSVPQLGWLAYVVDETMLAAWNGNAWVNALSLANVAMLGVNTAADATNRLAVKANAALFSHDDVTPGTGDMRVTLNKSAAARAASLLLQNAFSGRAEIGLAGDDDLHVKVSPDGASWSEALTVDRSTGALKINSALLLTGDITPAQITANQNDYNPSGLATAAVLRLSTDALRNLTGLQGGADGRVIRIINVGSNPIVLKNADSGSSAANRFLLGIDIALAAEQSVTLWYDATSSRWRNGAHAPAGKLIGIQVFATAGTFTYTRSPGCSSVEVEARGGGGGGGGVSSAAVWMAGGGGGQGGRAIRRVTAPGATETVTVGAGGAGGSTAGGNGGPGGTTSFGAHCSASGGNGGGGNTASGQSFGGAGGAGASGDINHTGQGGGQGVAVNASFYVGGGGGGEGGGQSPSGYGVSGIAGISGGGGSGAISVGGGGAAGGAGGAGYVIVREYQ